MTVTAAAPPGVGEVPAECPELDKWREMRLPRGLTGAHPLVTTKLLNLSKEGREEKEVARGPGSRSQQQFKGAHWPQPWTQGPARLHGHPTLRPATPPGPQSCK